MPATETGEAAFLHEALLYDGEAEFVDESLRFIRAGLEGDESVLVVVSAEKIELLREALGSDAAHVSFSDMTEVGRNPARLIPVWRDFVDEHGSGTRGLRGIGEPVGPDRSTDELLECQRHESLLNLAFDDSLPWRLLCPYDTTTLGPAVIDEARRTHPVVTEAGRCETSLDYRDVDLITVRHEGTLPVPRGVTSQLAFGPDSLGGVRRLVSTKAGEAGITAPKLEDLVLAVSELAANSVRHGGGRGTLTMWQDDVTGDVVCEVSDAGCISDPMAGRERPSISTVGGRGLWLVNQLCDLVELRSWSEGSTIRLHMRP